MTMIIRTLCLIIGLWLVAGTLHSKIVFLSQRASDFREVYTMESDGADPKRLTFELGQNANPTWSPDGTQIAFDTRWGLDRAVFLMDAEGENQRDLTSHGKAKHNLNVHKDQDYSPQWQPDGERIAFVRHERRADVIYTIDLDGNDLQLVMKTGYISQIKWAPNGERFAFSGSVERDDHVAEIYIINADGEGLWRVSKRRPDTRAELGGWSPDSRKLLYTVIIEDAFDDFLVIATLHGKHRKVIKYDQFLEHIDPQVERWGRNISTRGFGWSADGKSILIGLFFDDWEIYRYRLANGKRTQLTDNDFTDFSAHEWNPGRAVEPKALRLKPWGAIKTDKGQR